MLITRGNKGTIYCAARDGAVTLPPAGASQKADAVEEKHSEAPLSDRKRKGSVVGDSFTGASKVQTARKKHRPAELPKRAKISRPTSPRAKASGGVQLSMCPSSTFHMSSNYLTAESVHGTSSFLPAMEANNDSNNNQQQQQQQLQQQPSHHDGGVRNILSSVEAFFSWG